MASFLSCLVLALTELRLPEIPKPNPPPLPLVPSMPNPESIGWCWCCCCCEDENDWALLDAAEKDEGLINLLIRFDRNDEPNPESTGDVGGDDIVFDLEPALVADIGGVDAVGNKIWFCLTAV
jgi:hypothetical protein